MWWAALAQVVGSVLSSGNQAEAAQAQAQQAAALAAAQAQAAAQTQMRWLIGGGIALAAVAYLASR